MKSRLSKLTLCLCFATALLWLSACGSTRTENGVTIEESSSLNPLNYIPGF
ncbi:hypothetical protein SH580_09395 [Coraliomargarita algicola]|uniref:Uncharacterized protein n=1 Tax=Coraliomargarita algicola TaxID=3092156 RepID=A0ABZ0RT16_9BACT|nr:hypothetical protein [Coraliomargarita sp. J2-16]WPJ97925.1 hypothetical protein SH580_09395 [Coraliomargarita sp. J2-16]